MGVRVFQGFPMRNSNYKKQPLPSLKKNKNQFTYTQDVMYIYKIFVCFKVLQCIFHNQERNVAHIKKSVIQNFDKTCLKDK